MRLYSIQIERWPESPLNHEQKHTHHHKVIFLVTLAMTAMLLIVIMIMTEVPFDICIKCGVEVISNLGDHILDFGP